MSSLEMVSSGSIGTELGWKQGKVERFCRAARVQYDNSRDTNNNTYYRIVKADFDNKYKQWIGKGPRRQSVTAMEEARLKRNKKAKERAELKNNKKKKTQTS